MRVARITHRVGSSVGWHSAIFVLEEALRHFTAQFASSLGALQPSFTVLLLGRFVCAASLALAVVRGMCSAPLSAIVLCGGCPAPRFTQLNLWFSMDVTPRQFELKGFRVSPPDSACQRSAPSAGTQRLFVVDGPLQLVRGSHAKASAPFSGS